jgi:hypothetical protein
MEEIEAINPSVVLIQEPGPAGMQKQEEVRDIFKSYFDNTKMLASSNRIVTTGWQYGGVLTAAFNEWIHKVDKVIQDPKRAGRFNAM